MKSNTLFTFSAIYLMLVGLGFLLIPNTVTFGALDSTTLVVISELRQYGGSLLGIALVNWLIRKVADARARRAVALGNALGFGLVAIGGIVRQLNGAVQIGWAFVVLNIILSVSFFIASRNK